MTNLLDLDFVSHVSLVDDPAVDDARFLVAKRADGDPPISKEGRTLSQRNFDRLESILQSVKNGRVAEVEEELEAVLSDVADPGQLEQSNTLQKVAKSMSGDSNTDIDEFTQAIKEAAAEGVQEGLQEADLPDGGDSGSDGQDAGGQDGGSDQDINQELMDRIDELEERLTEDGDSGSDGQETQGGQDAGSQETQDGDGGSDGGSQDDLEKRLETLEKAVQQDQTRKGTGTALDSDLQEEASQVSKSDGTLAFQDAIQKGKQSQTEAQGANQEQSQESD